MTAPALGGNTIVPFLARIFSARGAEEYLGEPVSMAEHMLQGAMLAEKEKAADELIAAALLHDIGHFTSSFGTYSPDDTEDHHHDDEGASLLQPFFPPVVVECVRLHVAAKRYLCATDPAYFGKLSSAVEASRTASMSRARPASSRAARRHVRARSWTSKAGQAHSA